MSIREELLHLWAYFSFSFWTGFHFVWDRNMSALQPQTDTGRFFQTHRHCYIPPCTHSHTHIFISCAHIFTKLVLANAYSLDFCSFILFWQCQTVKFRLPEIICLSTNRKGSYLKKNVKWGVCMCLLCNSRHSSGASSLLSRQSLSPSHFQRSWMQRLFLQANSPGWHWGGGMYDGLAGKGDIEGKESIGDVTKIQFSV